MDPLKSKALEANLAQTRKIEFEIPEKHQWLLSLSQKYWGIHTRTKEFLTEFHHPYSNRKEVIQQLINISSSDFWIYKDLPEREKVLPLFLDIFDTLLKEKLPDESSKQLIFIYLNFFSKNSDTFLEFDMAVDAFLEILEYNFEAKYFSYIVNLNCFFNCLDKLSRDQRTRGRALSFMRKLIGKSISFWENSTKIDQWYQDHKAKMSDDYTKEINSLGTDFFSRWRTNLEGSESWEELVKSTYTFSDIIDAFRKKIDLFQKATEQFYYIFFLIHLPGMIYHRSYLLVDLNKAIKRISSELNDEQILQSINELFLLFSELKSSNTNLILDSMLTLGKEIINTHNEKLIHHFENKIIAFGFEKPGIAYLTNDWELKVNPNHVKNIRVWLELIEYNPEMMKNLLSALIINLRIGGIFIFDTDLFQKDVTQLLNSKISPTYKQIKQLTRIFPVYFNEIGAEGVLRDVTTKVDELSKRNDKLIHFLRKQIHTEGNNSHIQITYQVIRFWHDLDIGRLKEVVPQNVLDTIDTESAWVKGVHEVITQICQYSKKPLEEIIEMERTEVKKILSNIAHANKNDLTRVGLMIELFQILKEKYSFEANNIIDILKHYHFIETADIENLRLCLREKKDIEALNVIYSLMIQLNDIIFDPANSEGWENIYYKRHIAFGIPSMYGEYHESKFEALGLTFRLEQVASVLVSRIVAEINTEYFTAKTLKKIFSVIQLLVKGLRLDGISDQGFDSKLEMFQYSLTSKSFTIKQYINIFQFMEVSIKEIINKYFIRPYVDLLEIIIPQHDFPVDPSSSNARKKLIVQKSEGFYRELLSSAFLIQTLDNFIGDILNNLRKMVSNLSDEEIQNIMTYDSELILSPLYQKTPILDNQVFLGSKAYYLKKLYLNNYPVPPGFVISTEVFRRVNSIIKLSSLNAEIDAIVGHHIAELERISGLKFGNPKKPLLLSVRSGAAISMPGAMNTFLNVGLNDEITESLSKQENYGWTSWDCYRRLLQTWGMSYGLSRNDFDQIMKHYKLKYDVSRKVDFTPQNMKEIAYAYKKLLVDHQIHFESNPFLQIKEAIISVFNSWYTPRAIVYRDHMQIAEEWGTAVIVQQMVFGNLHYESGSGVLFTHDIQDNDSEVTLTGDFSFLSQGEDIVAGLINTLPISERQRIKHYHKCPFSLESEFPKIFSKLQDIAHNLIDIDGFGHQEIEFTFETSNPEDLYILQTRDMSIRKNSKINLFDESENKMERVGCGIGIGNDVLNGIIVFDMEDIEFSKNNHAGKPTILIRPDTVPDDIEMIFECQGLLTGKGGATSHAAVTASTLGKVCVVNCDDMIVNEKEKKCTINGTAFSAFDPIAIDGNNGVVYKGHYPTKFQEL